MLINVSGGLKLGRNCVFTEEQEEVIANTTKLLANVFCGLSSVQSRRVGFGFGERNEIKHNFNKDNRTAGKGWLDTFLKRDPSVCIRKPEIASISRTVGFS